MQRMRFNAKVHAKAYTESGNFVSLKDVRYGRYVHVIMNTTAEK